MALSHPGKDQSHDELAFSGNVAGYPDWRRRAKGAYASAKATDRPTVAPQLWRSLRGEAWQLLKDWDPEVLRGDDGFDVLLKALDSHYSWNAVSVLAEQIEGYLYGRVKAEGEQITAFLARERGNMLKFVEQVQAQLKHETELRNQEGKTSYHIARLSYLS